MSHTNFNFAFLAEKYTAQINMLKGLYVSQLACWSNQFLKTY